MPTALAAQLKGDYPSGGQNPYYDVFFKNATGATLDEVLVEAGTDVSDVADGLATNLGGHVAWQSDGSPLTDIQQNTVFTAQVTPQRPQTRGATVTASFYDWKDDTTPLYQTAVNMGGAFGSPSPRS